MYKKILLLIIILNLTYFWGAYEGQNIPADKFFNPLFVVGSISKALDGQVFSMELIEWLWVIIAVVAFVISMICVGLWMVNIYQRRNNRSKLVLMKNHISNLLGREGDASVWPFLLSNNLESFPTKSLSRRELVRKLQEQDADLRGMVLTIIDAHEHFERGDWQPETFELFSQGLDDLKQRKHFLEVYLPERFEQKKQEARTRYSFLDESVRLLEDLRVTLGEKLEKDSLSLFQDVFTSIDRIKLEMRNHENTLTENHDICPDALCEEIVDLEERILQLHNRLGKNWSDFAYLVTVSATNLDAALNLLHLCSQILNERKEHQPSNVGEAWIEVGLEEFTKQQARLKNLATAKRRFVSFEAKASYSRELNKAILEAIEAMKNHLTSGLLYIEE